MVVHTTHADEGGPLTPDFYDYAWAPLASCRLHDGFATVTWPDGTELACYALWLAENTFGIEPRTREMAIDPGDLPSPTDLIDAVVGGRGELVTRWSDGTETCVHPGWLRHVAEGRHTATASLPEREMWTTETFSAPLTVDGSDVLENPETLRQWLTALCRFGLARLANVPAVDGFVEQLTPLIGPVRRSNFGDVYEVTHKAEPDSTANTGLPLGQHTDLPTRETPPGFQMLHCVENDVPGGWSRMTDGLSVVDELRSTHPEDYEALTTLPWVFFNRSTFADHRWMGPIIDNVGTGYPLTIRAFHPVRGFPAMAPEDVPRAYAALTTFSRVAHDPRFQLRYPFTPGDLVAFDNRRVLHGRDGFDPGAGRRRLRGFYIDHDDVYSTVRVLTRRAEQASRAGAASTPDQQEPS